MPTEEQVVSIYAGTEGYLDPISVKDVQKFEKSLIQSIKDKKPEIFIKIRTEKSLNEEIEKELKDFLDEFVKVFK